MLGTKFEMINSPEQPLKSLYSLQCVEQGQPQCRSTDGVRTWVFWGAPSMLLWLVVSIAHLMHHHNTSMVGMLEQLTAESNYVLISALQS